ncbi:MAG: histidine kinase [Proteobacteria bacterium]|jgi:signal transduction histidine kinase|nr:histidine kinase [Pseudomonadota bacterium]
MCAALLAISPAVAHAEAGTKEEAQAMVEKAAALIKSDGDKAYAKFQEKDGGFIDRDLYVFVLDNAGNFKAHGAKPVLVGKGGLEMKDVNGFEFIKAFIAVKDAAWVDYKWPDPADGNKVKDKSTYIIRVNDVVVGTGYYK